MNHLLNVILMAFTSKLLIFNIKDWFAGLIRAVKMYIPVHFMPTLLLSPKSILKEPMKYIKKIMEYNYICIVFSNIWF